MGLQESGAIVLLLLGCGLAAGERGDSGNGVFVVPNFHPASCGWLTDFSKERNYCANSYLDHLDRVASDEEYNFVISEVNTMIAIRNFTPARFEELKERIAEGRVEAVNASFLESTICLSGGEALVKQGLEGLRWQEAMLGVSPRHFWAIDVTGMHEQMPQIALGLGLDTLVHCRMNNSGSTLYWGESPDGSRILTISPGHYNAWNTLFRTKRGLNEKGIKKLIDEVRSRVRRTSLAEVDTMRTPDDVPTLVLSGSGDYSLAPAAEDYPGRLIAEWNQAAPDQPLRFTTLSAYVDAIQPALQSGAISLPTVTAGWNFTYHGFWIQNPAVKRRYRESEHRLQATEMLAAIAHQASPEGYPVQDLYHAWLLLLLNMDRNSLWGAAGGMVFEDPDSWDVKDRFDWVDKRCEALSKQSMHSVRGKGAALTLFNPANWERSDPFALSLDGGGLVGLPCQMLPDGRALCAAPRPAAGFVSYALDRGAAAASQPTPLPPIIETAFYTARVDAQSGDLVSLKLKPSGREVLAAPANVLVAETAKVDPKNTYFQGNQMDARPERERLATSSDYACTVEAYTGPLATIVEARSAFHGGKEARRVVTFYHDYPRIDFDTYLEDIPDRSVILAEFPLAPRITEVRRGIPYGFSHGTWPEPDETRKGYMKGITAAVRWSHHTLEGGGGLALLDRGLSGREIDGNTPAIFLLNAVDKYMGYPCGWLSGKGKHHLQYALYAHETPWAEARVARVAWEYNCPVVAATGTAAAPPESFVRTSDNIIVQAMRREGGEIELRMAECLGQPGVAEVTVELPHDAAALTDLRGKRREALSGGSPYQFPIRAQQIVTLRLHTSAPVPAIQPLTTWEPFVPEHKRPALREYAPEVKGHPPHG